MDDIKLTIELVPKTCWYSNVRSIVSKSDWDKIRFACYKKAGNKCEVCGGVGPQHPVECHEIWDYDDEKKVQALKGFVALCPACHEVKHIGRAEVMGNGYRAMTKLARANDWPTKKAKEYIRQSFDVWQDRSRHEWIIDLRLLKKMDIKLISNERQQ